jgi:hypothetical protein
MVSEMYNRAAERLWEKIEAHRGDYDIAMAWREKFPWDAFCTRNPSARELANEVRQELNYELSETQCSWAVVMALRNENMEDYNKRNGTSLMPRV